MKQIAQFSDKDAQVHLLDISLYLLGSSCMTYKCVHMYVSALCTEIPLGSICMTYKCVRMYVSAPCPEIPLGSICMIYECVHKYVSTQRAKILIEV